MIIVITVLCQMAYYKLTGGKTAATYESCSTAAFKHGRTETVRSATTATAKACRLFHQLNPSRPTDAELMTAIHECTTVHSQLTKEAAMGLSSLSHIVCIFCMFQCIIQAYGLRKVVTLVQLTGAA